MASIHKGSTAREWIQSYEGEIWAFDILAALMKRSTPKSEAKLGALVVKFRQLEMDHGELFQIFTDRVTKCRTDIRVVDGSASPTDEATIIRTRH